MYVCCVSVVSVCGTHIRIFAYSMRGVFVSTIDESNIIVDLYFFTSTTFVPFRSPSRFESCSTQPDEDK